MPYSFDNLGTAPGSVVGVRWWSLQSINPQHRVRRGLLGGILGRASYDAWDESVLTLRGMYDYWEPGVNTASCNAYGARDSAPDDHRAPMEDCSCGFWAYWNVNSAPVQGDRLVMGVVEGYGKTLIGDKGFRCEKARLLGLTCDFIEQRAAGYTEHRSAGAPVWLKHAGLDTYHALGGHDHGQVVRHTEYEDDLAATAAVELELEARYGVPVYATPAYMLMKHPLTTDYAGDETPDLAGLISSLAASFTAAGKAMAEQLLPAVKALEQLNAKYADWVMNEPADDGTTIEQALAGLAVDLKPPEG